MRLKQLIFFFFISLLFFTSCIDRKKALYFNGVQDTAFNSVGEDVQPIIHKNDLLSISVISLNPEATFIFNAPNIGVSAAPNSVSAVGAAAGAGSTGAGYLVSQEGNIQFPVLGNITVEGLTKRELSDTIARMLLNKKLLVDPIVTVRFLNFRVTVLGEVARPTVVYVANEKISIFEALGIAGDLTIFAKRDNVLLIREEKGKKITKRINLSSSEILSSPYYYLKKNDIVYAEPIAARVTVTSNSRQMIPLLFSALSFIAIIFTYVIRRN